VSPNKRQADRETDEYVILGRALRELRDKAGLTQEGLAAKVGIGSTYVSQVEHAHRGIRWHTLLRFLDVLGVDLAQLGKAIDKQRRAR
jgi:XRE family transcriptional regulator, fatty acid utilization regulator